RSRLRTAASVLCVWMPHRQMSLRPQAALQRDARLDPVLLRKRRRVEARPIDARALRIAWRVGVLRASVRVERDGAFAWPHNRPSVHKVDSAVCTELAEFEVPRNPAAEPEQACLLH